MRRVLAASAVALLLMVAVVLAVFAASRMGEWTNPFGKPYRSAAASVRIGGPFTLIGPEGKSVASSDFHGKWMLIYFGYTHCPDACPTALNDIGVALDMMKSRRTTVAPLFITVDPERDTPPVMAAYTHQFSPQIVGLTGSDAAIRQAEREYHVYAARQPTADGGYGMDHSNIIYVMDPSGQFAGVIDGSANPEDIAAQVVKFEA